MMETVGVTFSGMGLSFLMHDNTQTKYFQEGFLLGELITQEKKVITDDDRVQVRISRNIRINGSLAYPEGFHLYDGAGRVDTDNVKTFVGELAPKVVGWYTYKANTSNFMLTFREKLVHPQFANLGSVPPEFFICCRLISEVSESGATHSFKQSAVRYYNGAFNEVPLHIENLNDPNTSYKGPEPTSPVFAQILKDLNLNPDGARGLDTIRAISESVDNHTFDVIQKLVEAEQELTRVQDEFREWLKAKRQNDFVLEQFESGACGVANPELDTNEEGLSQMDKEVRKLAKGQNEDFLGKFDVACGITNPQLETNEELLRDFNDEQLEAYEYATRDWTPSLSLESPSSEDVEDETTPETEVCRQRESGRESDAQEPSEKDEEALVVLFKELSNE